MDNPSGQRYVSLFHSNVFRFLNFAILKRDEWPKITETIISYDDKEFLNSLWCPDKCVKWFSSMKKNETMKFFWKDPFTLGELIEEVQPLTHLNWNLTKKSILSTISSAS